jgi:hypothetical protein
VCATDAIALVTLLENVQKEDLAVVEDMNAVEANRSVTNATALGILHENVRRTRIGATAAMKPDTSPGTVSKVPVTHHATTATRQGTLPEIAPSQHQWVLVATTATSQGTSLATAQIHPVRHATGAASLAT